MTDDAGDLIENMRFEKAAELLTALRPENPRWAPEPGDWIFRGHADASWKLLPSIHRVKSLRRFISRPMEATSDPRYCEPRIGDVVRLLTDFERKLRAAGIPIPGGAAVAQHVRNGMRQGPLDDVFFQLTALGQHHGLPTMLLDWTRVATYAAYFAASDVADLELYEPDEWFDVWALNTRMDRRSGSIDRYGTVLRVVEPARDGNPNMHAQGGVFTLAKPPIDDTLHGSVLSFTTVDDVVRAAAKQDDAVRGTMMRRLSLRRGEAEKVLHLLACERVAGTLFFPGLEGVVRSVRDGRRGR